MKKGKGFTLIELLATIVVLALILGISIYVAMNVINKSKDNTYKVAKNEIEKNTGNYLTENNERLFYLIKDENTEYQCVTVENLMDYGYLDKDVIGSYITKDTKVNKEDYIYIERDIDTKTIKKIEYVLEDSAYEKLCSTAVNALGDIKVTANPDDKTWSKYKDITIIYKLKNLNDQRKIGEYSNHYNYKIEENITNTLSDVFKNNTETKQLRVTSNGTLYVDIKHINDEIVNKSVTIERIDTIGPVITKGDYSGSNKVRSSVTIPLKVTDDGSGVSYESFTKEDIIVNIGDILVDSFELTHGEKEKYNLIINSDLYNGKIILTIPESKVVDMVIDDDKNGNKETIIDTGISFDNKYKISYDANGGINAPSATTYEYAENGTVNLSSSIPTKTGYTFLGWSTDKSATSATYSAGSGYNKNTKKDVTLYAIWRINKIYIRIDMNGGSLGKHNNRISSSGSLVTLDGGYNIHTINYGSKIGSDGLVNWNNSGWINITKSGKIAKGNSEWCTGTNGNGTCFNQKDNYAASKFCNASSGDCTVTLYVNWVNKPSGGGGNPICAACPCCCANTCPPNPPPACFTKGTKVLTPSGLKNIEDLHIGDAIYSYNASNNKVEIDIVNMNYERKSYDDIYTIYTENSSIKATPEHPFYVVDKGYVKVKNLKKTDLLLDTNGNIIKIKNIKIVNNSSGTLVYNLNVSNNHTYFVGNESILVHNKGGGGCFLAGTKVSTIDGSKPIEKIKVGDLVLSYNEGTGNNEYQRVTKLYVHDYKDIDDELYILVFDDNKQLKVTSVHKIFIKRDGNIEWIAAKDLKIGDRVMYANKEYHRVISISKEELKDYVYNFETEKNHNYYVGENKILVHNGKFVAVVTRK